MPYRSRHFPKVHASPAISKFDGEAIVEFLGTPLHVDKDDEARLEDFKERIKKYGYHSLSQADQELRDDIQARKEDRVNARCAPLARELEGYFEHLDLPPFPPPLPRSSLWLGNERPSLYKPKDIRPFYVACVKGSLDEVKRWIEERRDTRAITLRDGLDCAAMGNQVHVARYLIEEVGVAIHAYAVRAASKNRSLPLFELLLKHGYHPNQQAPDSPSYFGTALTHCLDDDVIACFLLDHGADPNAASFMDGRKGLWKGRLTVPMDRTSGLTLDIAVEKSSFKVIQKLLECGADPKYSRPLHRALNPQNTRLLDARPRDDWRAVMQIAIDYGADLNTRTWTSGTALSMAAHMKRWDVVGFLIERGADPRVRRLEDEPWQDTRSQIDDNNYDSFKAAARAARVPWEVSDELRVYLDDLCGSGPIGEAPEGALENPLVRFMVEAKNAKGVE